MISLDTKIVSLGREPAIRIAQFALRWCKRELGVNNRKKYLPTWYIRMAPEDDLCGEYDDELNEVLIYWDQCEDVRELISTCIHEWVHQTQPITSKYFKYPGSYSRNPYERAARYREKKYTPILWEQIKNKVNKEDGRSNKDIKTFRGRTYEKNQRHEGRKAKVRRQREVKRIEVRYFNFKTSQFRYRIKRRGRERFLNGYVHNQSS